MAKVADATGAFKNGILSRLPPSELSAVQRSLHAVDFGLTDSIDEIDQPARYCYFPEVGMISVVSIMDDGSSIEVGTIGREGMTGGSLILNKLTPAFRYFVQIEGNGYRLEAERLREVASAPSQFHSLIMRYENAFLTQTMQTAACNGTHTVQQRCCRWLLMSRDRAASDEFKLTQEFLALMLGVRRASVSDVIRPLQEAGLIQSHRGHVTILNAEGLQKAACECYERTKTRERPLN